MPRTSGHGYTGIVVRFSRRLSAACLMLVLTGSPIVASACALWCPPGMTHDAPAVAAVHEAASAPACAGHEITAPSTSGASAQVVTASPGSAIGAAVCCSLALAAEEPAGVPVRAAAAIAVPPAAPAPPGVDRAAPVPRPRLSTRARRGVSHTVLRI